MPRHAKKKITSVNGNTKKASKMPWKRKEKIKGKVPKLHFRWCWTFHFIVVFFPWTFLSRRLPFLLHLVLCFFPSLPQIWSLLCGFYEWKNGKKTPHCATSNRRGSGPNSITAAETPNLCYSTGPSEALLCHYRCYTSARGTVRFGLLGWEITVGLMLYKSRWGGFFFLCR